MEEAPIYEDELYDIEYEHFLLSLEIPDIERDIIPNLIIMSSENLDGMSNILFNSRVN